MRTVRDAWSSPDLPRGGVATIGNFDGLHRGQREILRRVLAAAGAQGAPSIVVTFDPHPLSVLRPEAAPRLLTTRAQKEALIAAEGIDHLLVIHFTPELAAVGARDFVRRFLHEALAVRWVFVGSSFAFGRRREGSLALLSAMGQELGFTAQGVAELADRQGAISSTRVRAAVAAGDVAEAGRLLGRPYGVVGKVVRGDERGRSLGWPTANVDAENDLLPADGVYVGEVVRAGEEAPRPAVTNLGRRPTFHQRSPVVLESHLLDFAGDLYGERVEVRFLERLRGERRFSGVGQLQEQIARDAEAAREYFRGAVR